MPSLPRKAPTRRTQADRSATTRAALIAAARQCLMDSGYGRTTAVDVCSRAGLTRGALFHHFAGLPDLFAATLDEVCTDMTKRTAAAREKAATLSAYIDAAWASFGHPDFKIVIEVWMAARNSPELRPALDPVIRRFRRAATPELNAALAAKVGRGAKEVTLYRLIVEAMIGMALGRAISPTGSLGHEAAVIALLKTLASAPSRPAP